MSGLPDAQQQAPPARKVKFIASDPARGGLPVKRKQVQHACSACRRRKRRCSHEGVPKDEVAGRQFHRTRTSPQFPSLPISHSPVPTPQRRQALLPTASADGLAGPLKKGAASTVGMSPQHLDSRSQSSRFVGDLNPEGLFMEAAASATDKDQSQKPEVGIWLSSSVMGSSGQLCHFTTSQPPPILDRFLLPFVRDQCLTCLPPEKDYESLRSNFLRKIHPILPVLPGQALAASAENPANIVHRQLVCLASGTDPDMLQHLRLRDRDSELLSPQAFSQALSSSLRAILETSIITDRILHIQALVLLSLYTQPTCSEEADLPASLGGRAIHHVHTLGLQLLRPDASDCDEYINLFCVVWALDRINAAMYGRPVLMHNSDNGADLETCIGKRPPCFRLFLKVMKWLDHVIELYRPGPSAETCATVKFAYIELPVLEAMIAEAGALLVPSPLLATIEVLYHAVVILSCRQPRPGAVSGTAALPPPSANARRSLAAERITDVVPRDNVSPLPFIPYAVSLALSVEYRKMRHTRLPMFRARSVKAFQRNCELLRSFSDHFWNANVVAGLGETMLKGLGKAATTLARDDQSPSTRGTPSESRAVGKDAALTRQSDPSGSHNSEVMNGDNMDDLVNLSLLDPASGQDVFDHFDPDFNLDAVEDALEANLDIGLPLNWGDWGHFAT